MQEARLAKVYAKSILDLAIEKNKLEEVRKDMHLVYDLCKENREFYLMLKSPIIKGDKKSKILEEIFKNKTDNLSQSFIQLLAKKGRANYLLEITNAFEQAYKNHKNIKEVTITSAIQLSEETIQNIKTKINQEIKDTIIEIKTKVKPEIIGGIVIELDDKLFDASVRNRLNQIKQNFLHNEYVAKI